TQVDASLGDRIVFHNNSEMDLSGLRRRASALGGRFQLKASKSEYLVSNDPSRLEADDILLSPGTSGDVLLKIFCDYDRRVGQLEVIEADRPIMVGNTVMRSTAPLNDGDTIRIDIGENLLFAAAIRAPHLSRRDRTRRLEAKLVELGLGERRDAVVGSPEKKTLSGGERKRLNIGLDMIGMSDVYLFDEPTSGLSSKDSEHVIEIVRSMAHNKIVIVTIHQPSSKIFQMFQKVILLDKGGRLVF